jgi:hypothetical protein
MMSRRVATSVVVALLALPGLGDPAAFQNRTPDGTFATWLETRAPGAFESATHTEVRGLRVAYRLDARFYLPLWVASLPIYSRDDVGVTTASYRDSLSESGEVIRAFEFFTALVPERLRGIYRMGLVREAIDLGPQGPRWTAYFGMMTAAPEQSLDQAGASANGATALRHQVTDGFTSVIESKANRFDVALNVRGTNAGAIYAASRPYLATRPPRPLRSLDGNAAQPLPALAFLGALQVSLRQAAASWKSQSTGERVPVVPFIHNATLRYLEITGHKVDAGTGRRFVAGGFVKDPSRVFRIDFRITIPGKADAPFRLWAELPLDGSGRADALPIPPIMFEVSPRSFVRLHYERTR